MSTFKVGAGKASINPTPDMFPIPTGNKDWNVGEYILEGIYDDMDCRTIAVESEGTTLLWVMYERGGRPAINGLEETIAQATGVPAENIMVGGTHSHTDVNDGSRGNTLETATDEERAVFEKYRKIEIEAALSSAKEALSSLRPAKYGYGETESYVNTNRDLQTAGGFWVEGRNLAGYSDKTLAILKFVDAETEELIAAFLNYGCHATCGYLQRDADGLAKTSGNFPGIACRFVEQHYGNGAVCMRRSGADGNQIPVLSHGLQYEYPDGYTSSINYPDGVGLMQMEFIGRAHGADAVRGLDAITKYRDKLPIQHSTVTLSLPAQKRLDGTFGAIRQGGIGPRTEKEPYGVVEKPQYPPMADDPDHPVKMEMWLFVVGDVALIFTDGEMYAEIGRDMKNASPYRDTMIVTHIGPGRTGYIQDKSSVSHKVFQAFGKVKPGASDDIIVDGVKELFRKL